MTTKKLSRSQRGKIIELLSRAVINKQNPHPGDLQRAAIILYDVNRLGYRLEDVGLTKMLDQSEGNYSETMKELLGQMANAYADLVNAMDDPRLTAFRLNEQDFT